LNHQSVNRFSRRRREHYPKCPTFGYCHSGRGHKNLPLIECDPLQPLRGSH